MPTFHSYLEDLNSSTGCCRSASLLIPTTGSDTNIILNQLRQWEWICECVLIRPWRRRKDSSTSSDANSVVNDPWYYQCLPTEEELLHLQTKYACSSDTTTCLADTPSSLQKDLVHYHIKAKSLIVPLTDDATAFILRVLFEMNANNEDLCQKANTIQKWMSTNAIMIVHNCDGNQTVSLSKEVDSFPTQQHTIPQSSTNENHFTFVDLFAGIGGFRMGMESIGGICIGSCEIDQYARDTYRRNFLVKDRRCNSQEKIEEFYVNDITRLDIPHDTVVDVLCGGFPCQSFSTMASFPSNKDEGTPKSDSNTAKHTRQGGLATPLKGKLFFHLLRILRKSRPKMFVFENVKGLMKLDNGKHFERILQLLRESGYKVVHVLVDSAWMLPQRRERIYFVGIRLDLVNEARSGSLVRSSSQLEKELRMKYQIYGNDIPDDNFDKYDRVLTSATNRNRQHHSLLPSRLGDILESHEDMCNNNSCCFLTPGQWQKVRNQGYMQLHKDGSSQLLTEDDACAQTLVSSYRQSYLMHSQFVVPTGSVHLSEQNEKLMTEVRKKKDVYDIEENLSTCSASEGTNSSLDQTLPRFFTPREW